MGVAVINNTNDLIQTRIHNKKYMAIIKTRGILVDMILNITPYVYGPFVTTDTKGIKRIINQCTNAIHGPMVAILLYYCKFCKTLTLNKLKMNPYIPCVANRLVNVLQQYILFHVDDCKLCHKDTKVNDIFIEVIREE